MAAYEKKTGGKLLAIPHNGNLSNGLHVRRCDLDHARSRSTGLCRASRMKWEPIYEVTQMKGDGETHPLLSPNDEFANFETLGQGKLRSRSDRRRTCFLANMHAKHLKRGLAYEAKLGVNPFKFGMVGSTDAHTALSTTRKTTSSAKSSSWSPPRTRSASRKLIAGRPAPKGHQLMPADQRVRPGRCLGPRQHARGLVGRDVAQGGLRHHRHADARAVLRRLRFRPKRDSTAPTSPSTATPRACPWAATSWRRPGKSPTLPGPCAARPGWRQSRSHPDRQGLARCARARRREGLRRGLVSDGRKPVRTAAAARSAIRSMSTTPPTPTPSGRRC